MATNDFQPFASGGTANVVSQATYLSLLAGSLANGFQSGTAASNQVNKVWRQASIMAAVMGQIVANTGTDALDTQSVSTLVTNLLAAIMAGNGASPAVSDSSTKIATTAYVVNRIAQDAPTKTGSGASGTWNINISGNAGSVTNGVYTSGTYADPAWISSLAGSKISGTVSSANTANTVVNGVYTTGSYANPAWITSLAGSKITGSVASATNATNSTNATNLVTANWTVLEVAGELLFQYGGVTKFKMNQTTGLTAV